MKVRHWAPGDPSGVTRRDFLAAGVLAVCLPEGASRLFDASSTAVPDPRLTARPGVPVTNAAPGVTQLTDELDGAGFLYVPKGYRPDTPAPLVVALHGGGGYAGFWTRFYEVCDDRGMVLLAPEAQARTWDGVRGMMGPDVRFIDSALQYTFDRCLVDADHLALIGFSDGASYALSLGPSNGDLFTHLIAFSPGFSTPEDPIVGSPEVFVSHGSQDRSLAVEMSRDAIVPMFEMDGYSIRYDEFVGGHEMPSDVVAQALDWFLGA